MVYFAQQIMFTLLMPSYFYCCCHKALSSAANLFKKFSRKEVNCNFKSLYKVPYKCQNKTTQSFSWIFWQVPYENGRHDWLLADWSGYIVFLIAVAGDCIFLRSGELGFSFFHRCSRTKKLRKLLLVSIYIFQLHCQDWIDALKLYL